MERRIILTDHAKESMNSRIGCAPDKRLKLATKAFRSEEVVKNGEMAQRRFYELKYPDPVVYKKLMGMIYVFSLPKDDRAVLITVYSPVNTFSRAPKPLLTNHD